MKVFIIGANGYIGSKLVQRFSGKYDIKKVSPNSKNDDLFLNLEKPDEFVFDQIKKGDFVIHLAAVSSPEKCTKDYERSYKINVTGTSYFIEKCLEKGAKVLFFSSDVVYGSSNSEDDNYFDENSECNPFGEYGEMKRAVEKRFLNENNFKVFRLSYVFSKDDKFTSYLKNCCDKNETAEIFHPFFRSVVYIQDIILALDKLINKWDTVEQSIFNLVGPESVSRKRMAELYQKKLNSCLKIKITEPDEEFFSSRPKTIRTRSLYLEGILDRPQTEMRRAYDLEKSTRV